MKKHLLWIMAACSVLFAGCARVIDLTEEEEDIIAEYAAGELIFQYKVSKGLIELAEPTEPETVTEPETATQEETTAETVPAPEEETIPPLVKWEETETTAAAEGETSAEGETTAQTEGELHISANIGSDVGMANLMEALQISGVELSVLGYTVEDKYPTEEYALSVEAGKGRKLLVVEYDVWNSEDMEAVMEIHPDDAVIKAKLNGTDTVNIYKTILKSDLLNMNGVQFAPGEAKVGVLIFSISDEKAENITSVQVKATAKKSE